MADPLSPICVTAIYNSQHVSFCNSDGSHCGSLVSGYKVHNIRRKQHGKEAAAGWEGDDE